VASILSRYFMILFFLEKCIMNIPVNNYCVTSSHKKSQWHTTKALI
jgi:hypothetical protein